MNPALTAIKHLYSTITAIWVILNLGFWVPFLLLLTVVRFLFQKAPAVSQGAYTLIEYIYRSAVALDSFWMLRVVGIRFDVTGELPDHPAPIVVVNHQGWFDIPIVQEVITGRGGPILKFLIKRQLVWVPIVGWICWALNFPRLYRGSHEAAREKDYSAIESATSSLRSERGALLIFAEGTRFTQAKHIDQGSRYQHLLNPRPGGLKIALESVAADTPVIDISIAYQGDTNFWRCLNGSTRRISIRLVSHLAGDIRDSRTWLDACWRDKDQWISQQLDTPVR